MPKHFLNNFEIAQKSTFLTRKIAKTRVSWLPKVLIFGSIFNLRALILPFWHQKLKTSVPPDSERHLKISIIFKTKF